MAEISSESQFFSGNIASMIPEGPWKKNGGTHGGSGGGGRGLAHGLTYEVIFDALSVFSVTSAIFIHFRYKSFICGEIWQQFG